MSVRIAVITFCITLMLIVTSFIDSFNHGINDVPQNSDVIIMLGGGDGRMEKAAQLYHEGYAEFVIITPAIDSIYSTSTEFAVDLGIPLEAIIEEEEATSTYTNATESIKIMEEKSFDSALIVTSDYHLKRSKLIYERMNDDKYDFNYIAALGSNGEVWTDRPHAKKLWFNEFYKLWGYRLGLYKFIDIPDKV